MIIEVKMNNYEIGGPELRATPMHKISGQVRIDRHHTVVRYSDVSEAEIRFIERVTGRKAYVMPPVGKCFKLKELPPIGEWVK